MATKKKASAVSETVEHPGMKDIRQSSAFLLGGKTAMIDPQDGSTIRFFLGMGEDARELGSAVTERTPEGYLKFDFPQFYTLNPNTKFFDVCGWSVEGRSFTVPERNLVMDFQEERDLSNLIDKNQDMALAFIKSLNTSQRKKTLQDLRTNLNKSRDSLLEKIGADFKKYTSQVKTDLKTIDDNVVEIETELDNLDNKPQDIQEKSHRASKERRDLNQQIQNVYLESVHQLLIYRGDLDPEQEPFQVWMDRATGEDFDNATKVLKLGNAGWNSESEATPLSVQEMVNLELKRLTSSDSDKGNGSN